MGKKPASSKPTSSKGAAAKGKAGKKQRGAGSNSGYDAALRDPLDRQLALLGLRIKNITADGNCFFRALSDQLQGDEGRHSELRSGVCTLMAEQAESFAPFVEDDQSLEGHLGRMRREGLWAGHMELQAASLLLESNIAIYQAGQPRWCIMNFPPGSRMLHLSYEDGQHYNSVRRGDDYSRGCPADIPDSLKPIEDAGQAQQCWSAADERLVSEGTGCGNPVLIRQQLQAAGGDVDAAIEAVIEIMAADDYVEPEEPAADTGKAAADTAEGAAAVEAEPGSAIADVPAGAAAAGGGDSAAVEAGEGEGQRQQTGSTESVGASPAPAAAAAAEGGAAASHSSTGEQQPQPAGAAAVATADADLHQQQQQQQQGQQGEDQSSIQHTANVTAPSSPALQQPPAQQQADCSSSKASRKRTKGVRLKGGSSLVSSKRGAAAADSKPPSRNKACPCGSGRKHKNCCGAGGHKTGAKQAAAAAGGAVDAAALPAVLGTLHI